MRSYGHRLVVTSSHYGARPAHAEWQGLPCAIDGEAVIDGVRYPDIVELTGYGTVGGLKGANCRHSINPYFPGITELPAREWPKHERHFGCTSEEHYGATQRQRELERRVRKIKREIANMEQAGIGLESPTYVQKRLTLGKQQSSLAKHCKTSKLPRQYEREKAYGVKQQPRALKSGATSRASFKGVDEKDLFKWSNKTVGALKSKDAVETFLQARYDINVTDSFRALPLAKQKSVAAGIDNAIREYGNAEIARLSAFRSKQYAGEFDPITRTMKINPTQDTYLTAYHETIHAIDAEKSGKMSGFLTTPSSEAYNLHSSKVVGDAIKATELKGKALEDELVSIFYNDPSIYARNRQKPYEITASALEQRAKGRSNKLINAIARLF